MYNVEDQSDLLLENLQGDDEGDDDILGEKGDGEEEELGPKEAWEIEGDLEQE